MSRKEIIALGNAITDIVVDVEDKDLTQLRLKKGCYNRMPEISLDQFKKKGKFIPGGSPTNVVTLASHLGAHCGLIGTVGNDCIGQLYRKDVKSYGIIDYLTMVEGSSGICYILVTPDGEKTSFTDVGVCGDFKIPFDEMKDFQIFHTSAYELSTNVDKTMEALTHAYKNKLKISFDLADTGFVSRCKNLIMDIVKHVDIVFANEHESKTFTGLDPEDAVEKLSETCEIAVVKLGKKGSLVKKHNSTLYKIPSYPTKIVDTTGAGDAYAGAFLYGYLRGFNTKKCGHMGSFYAARICEKYGGRIK